MVHLRDVRFEMVAVGNPEGFWPSVPLGQGDLDIEGFLTVLESAGYNGYLFIENAYVHPSFKDEDAAMAESIAYLRRLLHP